jgi:serine/threonine-protein kinase HipA
MSDDKLVLPAAGKRGQFIVKLAGNDYPDLANIENATMGWARLAGFSVPEHRIADTSTIDGLSEELAQSSRTVFVVRRFDRQEDGAKVHQEDFCQCLGLHPSSKFGDRSPRVSFDGVLRFVVDVCGEAQGRELSRRLGFVIASGNGDAHLKNWSVQWGADKRPTLAPLYDQVSTVAFPKPSPSLALRVGREDRFAHLDTSALHAFSRRSFEWAASEVMTGVEAAARSFDELSDTFTIPSSMREGLAEHWRSTPILRGLQGRA